MATERDRLLVLVEARVNQLEKGMAQATKATSNAQGRISRHTALMESNIARNMGRAGAAIATRLIAPLAALGAAGAIQAVGGIAREFASLGDEARRAGLSLQAFQELKFVAEQNRLGIDSLVDGIKELNLRADEFIVTGGGSAAEAFARLGYDAETLAIKLQDPSELFTEIIGKLGQLDTAAQIRIADEIFGGTGGERFVQLIEQGEDALNRTRQEAHDLGLVLSDELVADAAELDRKFNAVATTVSTGLKTAIVNAAGALGDFIGQFNDFMARWSGEAGPGAGFAAGQSYWDMLSDPDARNALRLQLALGGSGNTDPYAGFNFGDDGNIVLQPPTTPTSTPSATTGGGGRAAAVIAEADAVLKLIEALEYERDTIGMTARELAVANALRDAGTAATAEQRAEIEQLVLSNFDLQASVDAQAEAMENLQAAAQDALSTIINGFIEGKNAGEIFSDVLGNIGSQLLNMGITTLANAIFPGAGHIGCTFNFSEAA